MKPPIVIRSLLLVNSIALVGCSVGPQHAHAPDRKPSAIEVRRMSTSTKAAIEAKAGDASDALSRMDAYRARNAGAQ